MKSPSTALVPGFFEQFRSHPDRPAFGFSDKVYTYGEVMDIVQGILHAMSNPSFAAERIVAVLATPDVHTYAAILAILASGRAYVPIHPQQPPERNWSCLEQAGTHVMLQSGAGSELQRWLGDGRHPIAVVDTTTALDRAEFYQPVATSAKDLAYLLFTSGSTGTPKGVPIYHRNLEAFFKALLHRDDIDFDGNDRFLQMFDLTFDLSIMSAFAPMLLGASSYIPASKGVGYLSVLRALDRERITVALMVPSVLAFLEKYFDEIRLPHLRYALFCGEALPVALASQWAACVPNARIFNVYGPTEATIFCTAYEVPKADGALLSHLGIVSIGTAMDGTRLLVVNEHGSVANTGETGELCLAGDQVTDRYWRNPEKTAAAFTEVSENGGRTKVYRTGDVAFERDGHYYYCGRSDYQVKIAGYRVELGEIEFHARKMPGVVDAAAVAKKDALGNYVLRLFIQSRESVDDEAIAGYRACLGKSLPSYMVPQKIEVLRTFPLNQNGKIDRKQLAQLVGDV